jgi:hypothetical protein
MVTVIITQFTKLQLKKINSLKFSLSFFSSCSKLDVKIWIDVKINHCLGIFSKETIFLHGQHCD